MDSSRPLPVLELKNSVRYESRSLGTIQLNGSKSFTSYETQTASKYTNEGLYLGDNKFNLEVSATTMSNGDRVLIIVVPVPRLNGSLSQHVALIARIVDKKSCFSTKSLVKVSLKSGMTTDMENYLLVSRSQPVRNGNILECTITIHAHAFPISKKTIPVMIYEVPVRYIAVPGKGSVFDIGNTGKLTAHFSNEECISDNSPKNSD